ncbi:peptidase S41 [Pseudoflavitalea sp. X16]|uniref:S41 family peptidase n=1 Tax=Paraflavitalea devenefica TaxID=2716334 RepID=UPI0014209E21|nr:S41 family peptidase [Paraflavitalea devenefica]NII27680.1 peptidase S41 [Paraflavitalea devenefica]
MKHCLLTLWLFVPVLLFAQEKKAVHDSLTERILSKYDMQEDMRYLCKVMEEIHPGLYRYTPKPVMDQRLDSFYNLLTGDKPYYDYYRLMTAFVAGIRCAHTSVMPGGDWQSHFRQNAPLLPFSTHFINDRLYVTVNLTTDTVIKPGYEILHINGQPVPEIRRFIFDHSWSDGYNTTNKQQRLNTGFLAVFYYLLIARPDSFAITAKDSSGKIVNVVYPALTIQTASSQFRQNPVNKEMIRLYVDRKREDLNLEIKKEINTAVLTVRSFGGKAAKNIGAFLPKAMKKLAKNNIGHLIIDLRNNGGGWDSAGVLLFTYLISKPARYYLRAHTITASSPYLSLSDLSPEDLANVHNELISETDGTFTLKANADAGLSMQRPKAGHYTGKIYFLMNGGSASAAAEFLAAAHANQLGVFIGEEAGGNYAGGNGGSFIPLVLPHSKIKITLPLVYYDNTTKPPFEKGRGVMPDYDVPDNLENILRGIDTQKEFVFNLIRQGK